MQEMMKQAQEMQEQQQQRIKRNNNLQNISIQKSVNNN